MASVVLSSRGVSSNRYGDPRRTAPKHGSLDHVEYLSNGRLQELCDNYESLLEFVKQIGYTKSVNDNLDSLRSSVALLKKEQETEKNKSETQLHDKILQLEGIQKRIANLRASQADMLEMRGQRALLEILSRAEHNVECRIADLDNSYDTGDVGLQEYLSELVPLKKELHTLKIKSEALHKIPDDVLKVMSCVKIPRDAVSWIIVKVEEDF